MEADSARDHGLVERVLAGDEDAFAEIVRQHQRLVAGIAWRYGVPRSEIEDVVSSAFLKVYVNLHRFRPEYAFGSWLYRVATNHILDYGRRHRRDRMRDELPENLADSSPGPAESAEREETRVRVRRALARLKPHYRDTLFLVYVEGQSVEQAAGLLGVAEGTVKSRLLRGREAMRRILAPAESGAGGAA